MWLNQSVNTSRAWNGRQCWAQHKGDEDAGISSQTTGSRSTRHLGVGPGMGKGDWALSKLAPPHAQPRVGSRQPLRGSSGSQVLTGWTPLLGQMLAGNFFDYQPIREALGVRTPEDVNQWPHRYPGHQKGHTGAGIHPLEHTHHMSTWGSQRPRSQALQKSELYRQSKAQGSLLQPLHITPWKMLTTQTQREEGRLKPAKEISQSAQRPPPPPYVSHFTKPLCR